MNNARRKEIQGVIDDLENIMDRIEQISADEEEYLENMPESFQEGEKGDRAQEVIDTLDTARQSAEEAQGALEDAKE